MCLCILLLPRTPWHTPAAGPRVNRKSSYRSCQSHLDYSFLQTLNYKHEILIKHVSDLGSGGRKPEADTRKYIFIYMNSQTKRLFILY